MGLFTLEHGKLACLADFAVQGMACVLLAGALVAWEPGDAFPRTGSLILAGLAAWTALEYGLHRFVLHGVQPFRGWHAEHHRRPAALIGTPTIVSAGLVAVFVFLPAAMLGGWLNAVAFTLGVSTGYLAYSVTHHALHHWHFRGAWFATRRRAHARHHGASLPGSYGVTTAWWDWVFGSVATAGGSRRAVAGSSAGVPLKAPPRSRPTDLPSAGSRRRK